MEDLKADRYYCEYEYVTGMWFVYDRLLDNSNSAVAWFSKKENAEKTVREWNQEEEDNKESIHES